MVQRSWLLLCAFLALAFAQECSNQEFSLEYNQAEDTWIEIQNRLENHGEDSLLWVSWNRSRTLVQFPGLGSEITRQGSQPGCECSSPTVERATLRLLGFESGGDWSNGDVIAHRLPGAFAVNSASWQCRRVGCGNKCCHPWRLTDHHHGNGDLVAFGSPLDSAAVPSPMGPLSWDVTDGVAEWLADSSGSPVLSFLLRHSCETSPGGWLNFWSCEASQCPTLHLQLRSHCSPPSVTPRK